MTDALTGIRIADFSRVLAGPVATMILGDLGADVVKIERPGTGDDTRGWGPPWSSGGDASYYLSVNRNKRSIALDLKDPDDLAVARSIALRSDVVIENFRPGVMARAGLDYETLAAERRDLVSCRIAGIERAVAGVTDQQVVEPERGGARRVGDELRQHGHVHSADATQPAGGPGTRAVTLGRARGLRWDRLQCALWRRHRGRWRGSGWRTSPGCSPDHSPR